MNSPLRKLHFSLSHIRLEEGKKKTGLRLAVTKLMRLEYHLGSSVYVTLLFELEACLRDILAPSVNHQTAEYMSSRKEGRENVSVLEENH